MLLICRPQGMGVSEPLPPHKLPLQPRLHSLPSIALTTFLFLELASLAVASHLTLEVPAIAEAVPISSRRLQGSLLTSFRPFLSRPFIIPKHGSISLYPLPCWTFPIALTSVGHILTWLSVYCWSLMRPGALFYLLLCPQLLGQGVAQKMSWKIMSACMKIE